MCVHGRAKPVDGVAEVPETQTSQPTEVNETHSAVGGASSFYF